MLVVLGAAAGLASGRDVVQSLAEGIIQGAVTFGFAWLLLRYDLRTVPAFVATGIILEAVLDAIRAGTPAGWLACATTSLVAGVLAWRAIVLLGRLSASHTPKAG